MFYLRSHAATPFISSEAETGSIKSPASVVNDSAAGAGKAVMFSQATITPPLTGVPARVAGYWWSDAESPTALTQTNGKNSTGAEWSGWGQGDTATYGIPAIVSANTEGIATPPSGDKVFKLRHSGATSPFGSDYNQGLHPMHKFYKQFTPKNWPGGAEPTNRDDGSPDDVSGRYITYMYFRMSQFNGVKGFWSNVMQYKEDYYDTSGAFVSNPSYWFGFNFFDAAHPVMNLSSWGGRHQGPTIDFTQFYDKWTKFEFRLYQGDRLEVYINDKLFDTAHNSEYPVGRMDFPGKVGSNGKTVNRTLGWTYGVGNYTNGGDYPTAASGVYVDLSTILPIQ